MAKVVVIGAGIIGACTAVTLAQDGHIVTILDPDEPGGPHAASFGNAAWISPASVVPMSMPGLWRKVPGFLLDPLGPLTIRWTALPRLAPWLLRFVLAGATRPRVERTAAILAGLLRDAPARHTVLAAAAGVPNLIHRTGLLYVYPDRAAFAADAAAWALRKAAGVQWTELGPAELRAAEPDLDPRYGLGILVPAGAHCSDPGGYVAALVAHAVSMGAQRVQARAAGFRLTEGRLTGVVTETGEIPCDKAVIAAGIRSKTLAALAGDRVSLESERGYHVCVSEPEGAPRRPTMPSDGRMGLTLTAAGLRAAGQVEMSSTDAAADWRRANILLDHLKRTFPGLPCELPPERVSRWMGHRPSTPDGLPVIGPARASPDIIHAFGHGHIGLATGPATGRLVAELIGSRETSVDVTPFAAGRFG